MNCTIDDKIREDKKEVKKWTRMLKQEGTGRGRICGGGRERKMKIPYHLWTTHSSVPDEPP